MDTQERRRLIKLETNPDIKLDYIISISSHFITKEVFENSIVSLRYVPDKLIIRPESFGYYLRELGMLRWEALEDIAATTLNDINNELIARWLQVIISTPGKVYHDIDFHKVLIEDKQPNWNNEELLSRLKLH